ncbi:hypothetical protein KIN20_009209 [Parelaphostrongylus tenuis]|uniref:Uncharacterized protein n=1 Tax=Parelaphostrongylus tenuis TaxID=148309 RepID=A0AAD5QJG4_PARTN|nr:hypothetical protein KIN20_009209 [Parelaphostrongylus tenuis]
MANRRRALRPRSREVEAALATSTTITTTTHRRALEKDPSTTKIPGLGETDPEQLKVDWRTMEWLSHGTSSPHLL